MKTNEFASVLSPLNEEVLIAASSTPISFPDDLPPTLYTLNGILVATLFVRALIDFIKSVRK